MIHSGGFFSDSEIPNNKQINARTCASCGLYRKSSWPKPAPTGEGEKQIYIVKSSPTPYEEQDNTHWVKGESALFHNILKRHKLSAASDCITDYAVCCGNTEQEQLTSVQIEACHSRLWNNVKQHTPKIILLLGDAALKSFLHNRWLKGNESLSTWRGFVIPDRINNAWVMATYDFDFIDSVKKKQPVVETIFKQDVQKLLSYRKKAFPEFKDEKDCVKYLLTEEEQLQWFKYVCDKAASKKVLLSFDYESTGLKPHAEGHKIACCSMCIEDNETVVFPFPLSTMSLKYFRRILTHKNIFKTAHNIKFEDTWTRVILGFQVQPWVLCTMLASHILDNRPGITGLKFQGCVNFGLMSYDEDVAPFLKGVEEKNANSINRVFQAPKAKLLQYCAIDSLLQYKLAIKQLTEMNMLSEYID